MLRYHDGIVKARHYIDEGRIGRLASIRAFVGEHLPSIRPDYRTLHVSHTIGAFDLMHDLDLSLWFVGLPVRKAFCVSGNFGDIGIDAPDTAEFLIEFDGPCVASVHLDLFQRPRRRRLELIGTQGVIDIEFSQWDRCDIDVFDVDRNAWEHEELITKRNDMFLDEDREFLVAVSDDTPIRWTIDEGRKSLDVILQAIQS